MSNFVNFDLLYTKNAANLIFYVSFEVFTAVTMKNAVF
jgi:hypothetical protein